ncbi:MAG TPA: hypothetical protein VIC28_04715 [Thermoanaerobaculia bacterium]
MAAPTMNAPASGVTVRMYRQGLGDCFLLAFPAAGERPFFLLIDCGVLLGTPQGSEKVRQVAEHILESTGGRLDVLVATHQHWDHLSGFEQARDVFDRLQIGEVWVAWTEDPEDPVASGLRRQRETALRALAGTVARLRASGDEDSARTAEGLAPILGFFGDLGAADGGAAGGSAIVRAMKYVVGRGKPPRYRTPGEGPLPLPGAAGARVYVLGPPKEMEFLKRSNPRSGEAYEAALAVNEETSFFAAVLGAHAREGGPAMSPEERALANLCFPFDKVYRVPVEAAQEDLFFQESYFGAGKDDVAWRRIDADWLSSAGGLALQLDSNTNNTSLALAVELVPSGKVLLFPGDAQAGNWRSWRNLGWTVDGAAVTIDDLLRRTVLYKVGHHASHNATLREQGLERMENPDLVAMIPVDEEMAHKPKGGSPKGWDMPFPPLLKRLEEKTAGRVIRVDQGLPKRPGKVPASEWKTFEERCVEEDLYLEITVAG